MPLNPADPVDASVGLSGAVDDVAAAPAADAEVSSDAVSVESIAAYLGDAYPKAAQFRSLLIDQGTVRGLIGPREASRIWERHILNCAPICDVLPTGGSILDLGSGAGLPGIVVAIMRPAQHVILLETMLRRTNWLTEVATELSLSNVEVVRGRAGEIKLPTVPSVTARAVASLDKLMGWSSTLLSPGGSLCALKGDTVSEEIDAISGAAAFKKITRGWSWPPEVLTIESIPGVTPTTIAKTTKI